VEWIKLNKTQSVLMKMSEGNPGALTTMMQIMMEHDNIDPQAMMGGMGVILLFDTFQIYGSSIYILFNDQCNRDVRELLMLMRATQLGLFSSRNLKQIADDQMGKHLLSKEQMDELDKKVCEQLEQFTTREAWENAKKHPYNGSPFVPVATLIKK
jgi:hypothetical protein